jgi:hypothetical protein
VKNANKGFVNEFDIFTMPGTSFAWPLRLPAFAVNASDEVAFY